MARKRKQVKKEIIRSVQEIDRLKKEPVNREEQIKSHKKVLRNILIVIGIILAGVFLFVILSNSFSRFEYRGVDFEIVRFCDAGPPCLVMYKTSLPVKVLDNGGAVIANQEKKDSDYNFYLRNDPRKLDVNFTGDLIFRKNMVLNSNAPFVCEGKGAIAAANLVQLYEVLGTKVINDENASCDLLGNYIFVQVRQGNKTSVSQFSPACYSISIKDCEILDGTERFMIETFVKVNEDLKK